NTRHRLMVGALGCLALASGTGPALADAAGQAYIAGQLMPKMLQTTRGLPIAGATRSEETSAAVSAPRAVNPPVERRRADRPSTAPSHREPRTAAVPAQPSVVLDTIQFEFGSAQLKPESVGTLRDLGNALNQELKEQKLFLVAGHTDAVGSRPYNV